MTTESKAQMNKAAARTFTEEIPVGLSAIEPITPETRERAALCGYRVTYLSDDVLTISHWIADARYDLAVGRLLTMRRNLELLAGYLSGLVESAPPHITEIRDRP